MVDTKLTAQTTRTIGADSLFYVVIDPSGTPLFGKVTGAGIVGLLLALIDSDDITEGSANLFLTTSERAIIAGLSAVATSGAYGDLSGTPSLATVATSGSFADLSNTPTYMRTAVADTAALTAIPEASCVDNMVVLLETGHLWRYKADEDGTDPNAQFPDDNPNPGPGAWVPLDVFRLNFANVTPSGTLPIANLGGNASTGDITKFLNQRGLWAVPAGSVITDTVNPSSAPSSAGTWWFNLSSGIAFFSVGTGDVSDWVEILTINSISAISDLAAATSLAADYLMFEQASGGALKATTIANFIADHGLATKTIAPNAQTGTTYTFVLGDAGGHVTSSNGSAQAITIPTNASVAFPVGTIIKVTALGSGTVTITGASGVTVNGVSAGGAAISAQYTSAILTKLATDTWLIEGNIGTVS